MKFQIALLALLSLVHSLPSAEPEAEADLKAAGKFDITEREASLESFFEKRACAYTCTGMTGASAGKYCGFCKQVLAPANVDNIYQVSGSSGAKNCCDYGLNNGCKKHYATTTGGANRNCKNTANGW
ncbi:hypothetical protein LZ554_004342 [Drepanopeziza brunnea f. sp. 'monogermtubi']|nr:hypothetical protein LZ554_004342 [Drepanopeziza brunnea f. sp. 'monogermtubi']